MARGLVQPATMHLGQVGDEGDRALPPALSQTQDLDLERNV